MSFATFNYFPVSKKVPPALLTRPPPPEKKGEKKRSLTSLSATRVSRLCEPAIARFVSRPVNNTAVTQLVLCLDHDTHSGLFTYSFFFFFIYITFAKSHLTGETP